MQTISSICPYCGCGCRLNFVVDNGKIVKVLPDKTDEVSEGKPCIKGLTLHEVLQKERILKPMIRKNKNNKNSKLQEVSWKEAYEFIYQKIKNVPPEKVFFNLSGKITNEDNFVIKKIAKEILQTNNIDSCCSRLCHQATIEALQNTFGNSGIPWKMDDVYNTDCLMVIGSNPASNYPVLFNKILKSKSKGMKLISVQPIKNLTSQHADISFIIKPFSESVFLSGIINFLIESRDYEKKVEDMKGFLELYKIVGKYSPKNVAEFCQIDEKGFKKLLSLVKNSKSFAIIHGMGITQDVNATENVYNILNLLILKNGKLLSCRGEINVQGAGDMNYLGDIGKNIIEMFLISPAKVAFISSFNPAQSLPNLDKVHKNMKKMFIVQFESYKNLTSKFADVILPTPVLIERTGTITNGERRVRFVKKIVEPMGESKPEWVIFQELSKNFSPEKSFNYKNEKEIFQEIKNTIPAYKKIDVDEICSGKDCWSDKEIKFVKLNPKKFKIVKEIQDKKYQFVLTTFRSQYHFLTGEMTSKSETLRKFSDGAFCYINKEDAKKLSLKNGDKIKISSRVSSIITEVKIDERIPEKIIGMHFHFENLLVNKLFPTEYDKETFTPNYKSVPVKIEKIK